MKQHKTGEGILAGDDTDFICFYGVVAVVGTSEPECFLQYVR